MDANCGTWKCPVCGNLGTQGHALSCSRPNYPFDGLGKTMSHDSRESEDDFGESSGEGVKVGNCEGYPSFWQHATIHLNPQTGEMHSEGDHSVRTWLERRLKLDGKFNGPVFDLQPDRKSVV